MTKLAEELETTKVHGGAGDDKVWGGRHRRSDKRWRRWSKAEPEMTKLAEELETTKFMEELEMTKSGEARR